MKITYDDDADALYIGLTDERFATNKKLDNQTILDLDENESIIGIEILNASKRISESSLKEIKLKNVYL